MRRQYSVDATNFITHFPADFKDPVRERVFISFHKNVNFNAGASPLMHLLAEPAYLFFADAKLEKNFVLEK